MLRGTVAPTVPDTPFSIPPTTAGLPPTTAGLPPTTAGIEPGRLLAGRYRLRSRLARGGMAEVWEAEDEVLTRPVAVKILLPHLAADEQFVIRFRREAVAAARLSHPHIVAIFDTFSDDGTEAIVMELVPGRTLRRLLDDRGALPVTRAVDIAVAVAEALDHAHRAGLVHRDIKPGNILLAAGGRIAVTDFGIAKAVMDTTDERADLTEGGTVMGTAKYLSPEQVRGEPVDARADVYALGCVLYEMLCGRPPFAADTPIATAMARLHERPLLPRQCRPGIPRAVENLALRCLAVDPAGRPSSAGDLAAALRSIELTALDEGTDDAEPGGDATVLTALPDATPPSGTRFTHTERSWLVPAVVIVVVAVGLGAAGMLLGRTNVGRQLFEGAREAVTGRGGGPPPVVVEAIPFDPLGSGGEHDSERAYLVDGKPDTTWSTEGYDNRLFGGLKDGVGVILRLEEVGRLGELVVVSATRGWAAQVHVADEPPPDLEAWGTAVAREDGIAGSHTFDLGGARGGAVLLWITDLGDGTPKVRVEIGELSVR